MATSLFDGQSIEGMMALYSRMLDAIVTDCDERVADVQLQDDAALQQLCALNNRVGAPCSASVHQLFERQVAAQPEQLALCGDNDSLTYAELNRRANQLARKLSPGEVIGLYLGRSNDLIIAMLAALKAGCAYLPLSLVLPKQRIQFMLDESAVSRVICAGEHLEKLDLWVSECAHKPTLMGVQGGSGEADDNLSVSVDAEQLAYVMYTSGTSGKPKGVMIPHRAVVSLVHDNDFVQVEAQDCFAHLADPSFDAATFEIWGALSNGATLALYTANEVPDAPALAQFIEERQVSVMWLTRSLFDAIYLDDAHVFAPLRYLLVGGEALTPNIINDLVTREQRPQHILNGYGPTESTTFTTVWPCEPFEGAAPLGRPINGRSVVVLDKFGRLAPIGVPGELCIGGPGLALGYLNRSELTKQRFIEHPLQRGERLYRSGDWVRLRHDGLLVYLGRQDLQVKIRGYRIEPGEVEQLLLEHPDMVQVCVNAEPVDGQTALVAYCRTREQENDIDQSRTVEEWTSLFDDLYQAESGKIDTFDISGWECSLTGKPIDVDDMREWQQATVHRIMAGKPRNVLEIGCGTGLLLYPLAGQIDRYHGLDISAKVVARLNASFDVLGISNATVQQGRADALDSLNLAGSVDTVIINSVTQYFPHLDYLTDVLEQAIARVDSGQIYIGDVRDLRLLQRFHRDVLFKRHGVVDTARAEQNARQETELLVDPGYFLALAQQHDKVCRVQVCPKFGEAGHEMNLYRYDVIIHIGEPTAKTELPSLAADELPALEGPAQVLGYPNRRLTTEGMSLDQLKALADGLQLQLTACLAPAGPRAIGFVLPSTRSDTAVCTSD